MYPVHVVVNISIVKSRDEMGKLENARNVDAVLERGF